MSTKNIINPTKNSIVTNERGAALVVALIMLVIMTTMGATLTFTSIVEGWLSANYRDSKQAFYVAEAGIGIAIQEFNHGEADFSDADGWSDGIGNARTKSGALLTSDGSKMGDYTIVVTDPTGANPTIRSTGFVPGDFAGAAQRTVRVILERPVLSIPPVALASGGNVYISGNVGIINTEGGHAIQYPGAPYTFTKKGSATADPPMPLESPFPTFKEIFGMTEDEMQAIADATYTEPANNVPLTPTGITWINGDARFNSSNWDGEGILIVTGNLEIRGGSFEGVVYVMGDLEMRGNPYISGAILVRGALRAATGNPDIRYDSGIIELKAMAAYPWGVKIWHEL